eukprot:10180466-Lingulodinium_polyedra.AAC.1
MPTRVTRMPIIAPGSVRLSYRCATRAFAIREGVRSCARPQRVDISYRSACDWRGECTETAA